MRIASRRGASFSALVACFPTPRQSQAEENLRTPKQMPLIKAKKERKVRKFDIFGIARREGEVRRLLDKLRPELITLDAERIATVQSVPREHQQAMQKVNCF